MREQFKKEDGYYITVVENKTYYMRSHPMDMYSSMKMKQHDRLLAFMKPTGNYIERGEVLLNIDQLEKYIIEVHNEADAK